MPEASTAASTMSLPITNNIKTESGVTSICIGCSQPIQDKFIYKVLPDTQWHENCLKCAVCECKLNESVTCFIRNGKAYCKPDYNRLFAVKCDRCGDCLNRNDLVMRCKSKTYHFECFSCSICCKKLLPGDEFQLRNDTLYCKEDALIVSAAAATPPNQQQTQLYLSNLNNSTGSSFMTPESSIKSSSASTSGISSSSSSSSTFSPSNNSTSSSCSSSLVDSPTNNGNNTSVASFTTFSSAMSSTNSSLLLNHSGFSFNNTSNSYYHLDRNNNNTTVAASANPSCHQPPQSDIGNKMAHSYSEYDFHDKEDDRSISDAGDESNDDNDDNDGEEEDMSDLDNSISDEEESSLNESATSVGGRPPAHKNKKGSKKFNNGFTSSNGLLQMNGQQQQQQQQLHHHQQSHRGNHHHHNHHRSGHSKPARVRTVLNEKQLHTLRTYYNANPRPDAMLKEQLVEMTGLNPRVIRVWFQNKRCKDKKKSVLTRPDYPPLPLPNHAHYLMQPTGSNNGPIRLPVTERGLLYDNCY